MIVGGYLQNLKMVALTIGGMIHLGILYSVLWLTPLEISVFWVSLVVLSPPLQTGTCIHTLSVEKKLVLFGDLEAVTRDMEYPRCLNKGNSLGHLIT